MHNLKKILFLLNPIERKRAVILLIMTIIMALIDTIGVASVLPFMAVLTNPEIVETNLIIKKIYEALKIFGVENVQQFLFILGVGVFALLVFSLIFKAFIAYFQVRFVLMCEFSIGKLLMKSYLHQPYSWFLNRNSADLGKNILSEVSQVIGSGLRPLMDLIAQSLVAISLITLLIISNVKLALIVGLFICGTYSIIFYLINRYLNLIGKKRMEFNRLRFVTISEAFGAFKQIKIGGLEQGYIDKFSHSAQKSAMLLTLSQVINQMPRFFLEAITFGGILLIILYMMSQTGNFNNSLPIISLYAFAGYRLMPAVQQIYVSFAKLSFIGPSLDKLYNDVKDLKIDDLHLETQTLTFRNNITLEKISYNYPNAPKKILNNISMTIPAKSTVGIIGTTGSGKTTTVDIILGLLDAQNGTLKVDGVSITKKNIRSWQKLIGYVPQNIYLCDDTIAANIAYGVETNKINHEAVVSASKIANLHQFVDCELPNKYETIIGERGIRLSGGQCQRIGIARALYHKPELLIFDEATSALDNQTEQEVMAAVNNLKNQMTIIIIAHRLNTVKNCDIVFKIEKGEIVKSGTFFELMDGTAYFK